MATRFWSQVGHRVVTTFNHKLDMGMVAENQQRVVDLILVIGWTRVGN